MHAVCRVDMCIAVRKDEELAPPCAHFLQIALELFNQGMDASTKARGPCLSSPAA
jgi:hypothetical protein